jgi:hypothetical protein
MNYLADHSDIVTLSDVFFASQCGARPNAPVRARRSEQYTNPVNPRSQRIVDRVLALRDEEVRAILDRLIGALAERPRNAEQRLLRHFDRLSGNAIEAVEVSKDRKLLDRGLFLRRVYVSKPRRCSIPSMIAHPEDAAMPDSGVRFLLSLRSVGEGHVSSVTFRTGSWSPKSGFQIEEAGPEGIMLHVVRTEGEGENLVTYVERDTDCAISDVVLFPTTVSQRQGIEDMRLVVFEEGRKGAADLRHLYGVRRSTRASGNDARYHGTTHHFASPAQRALFDREGNGTLPTQGRRPLPNAKPAGSGKYLAA